MSIFHEIMFAIGIVCVVIGALETINCIRNGFAKGEKILWYAIISIGIALAVAYGKLTLINIFEAL